MGILLTAVELKLKYIPFSILTEGDTFCTKAGVVGVFIKIDEVYLTEQSIAKADAVNAVHLTTGTFEFFKQTYLVNVVTGEFSYTKEKEHDESLSR